MTAQPWTTGPSELLEHGLSLLAEDSDKNRRFAMIAIDNAVELAIKTFLGLPRRITGLSITRKQRQEIGESFPRLLDAFEQFASDKLDGIDLGDIEWYHQLRNQLYHQGNGLTVELAKVEVYSEIARLVFKNLFNIEVRRAGRKPQEQLGGFFASWARLEQVISQLAAEYRSDLTVTGAPLPPAMAVVPALQNMGVIPGDTAREIDFFRALRNKVVHGVGDYSELLGTDAAKRVDMLTETVLTISDEPDTQEHRSVRSGHRGARS